MARKQQSRSAQKTLEGIRERRLALEAKIRDVQGQFFALQKEFEAMRDEHAVQQHRRKLRYPTT